MKKIVVVYGSSTDNTKHVANVIAKKLTGNEVKVFDVARISPADLEGYTNLILGTSTLGLGDLQDDWDSFLPKLKKLDLNGKVVALFGLGDSSTYSDTFVDGLGILYEALDGKGCRIVGEVSPEGYTFDDSRAVVDGQFVGLPLDEDNESDQTEDRLDNWIASISPEFI